MMGASLGEFFFFFLRWGDFEELSGQSEPLLPVRHVNASFIHSSTMFKLFQILQYIDT